LQSYPTGDSERGTHRHAGAIVAIAADQIPPFFEMKEDPLPIASFEPQAVLVIRVRRSPQGSRNANVRSL
jgi:hypothetical protein